MQSIAQVAQAIAAGMYDVAVAGGTESMSMVPMGGNKVSANPELMEQHPEVYTSMGATAENVAAALRGPPRRPGRVRLREPAAGGRGAQERHASRTRSSP